MHAACFTSGLGALWGYSGPKLEGQEEWLCVMQKATWDQIKGPPLTPCPVSECSLNPMPWAEHKHKGSVQLVLPQSTSLISSDLWLRHVLSQWQCLCS